MDAYATKRQKAMTAYSRNLTSRGESLPYLRARRLTCLETNIALLTPFTLATVPASKIPRPSPKSFVGLNKKMEISCWKYPIFREFID